jgi:Zn-dependent alcohol dehydrogenase
MLTKTQILNTVNSLSNKVELDELIDKLIFMDKVEKGLTDVKEGKVLSAELAKTKLKKWLK